MMNVYVFGNFCGGYSQYPNDLTSKILREFYPKAKSKTQIAIHRDGNLIYYCYIRKLEHDSNQYIGICFALTGLYIRNVKNVFKSFEQVIELAAKRGTIIHYDESGLLTTSLRKLYEIDEEVAILIQKVNELFAPIVDSSAKLPPTDFSVSHDSVVVFSEKDNNEDIIKASYTFGYTFIYKDKDYNTVQMNSYQGVLFKVSSERDELKIKCSNLSSQLARVKAQQRNLKWVSILGAIALILGFIVWNKVLFPSEVTNYKTQDFTYYGPMKNGKPNGIGVAIYPTSDDQGRKYYVGNFENGIRKDKTAILLWNNGNYYYGEMVDDKFGRGTYWSNSQEAHFTGRFKDDKPYEGIWYEHKILQRITP